MTAGPTRRLGPVELFVGVGVLAAAWGLLGRMVIPLVFILIAVLAARIGFRSGGARLRSSFVLSLSPMAPLAILLGLVLFYFYRTRPIPHTGTMFLVWAVLWLTLGGLLLADVFHGLFCIVSAIRPSAAGERRAWCLCGLAAWASIAGTLSFLYLFAALATYAGMRAAGDSMWQEYLASLLPAALLVSFVAPAVLLRRRMVGPDVLELLPMVFCWFGLATSLRGVVCLVRAARDADPGSRQAWLLCGLAAICSTAGTGHLLWILKLLKNA